jgi:uncharacterized membrane protein YgcG
MKTYYPINLKNCGFFLAGIVAIITTSCGSYQNASYYDNDGVYGSSERTKQQVVNRSSEENVEQSNEYAQKFRAMQDDYTYFTDVDSYQSTQAQDTVVTVYNYQYSDQNYAGWGNNSASVTVNYYDTGWGWNNWYGPNWGWGWNSWYGNGYYGPGWGGYYNNGWGWNGYRGRNVAYNGGPRGGNGYYNNGSGRTGSNYNSGRRTSRTEFSGTPRTSNPRGSFQNPRTAQDPRNTTVPRTYSPRQNTTVNPRNNTSEPRNNQSTPRNNTSEPRNNNYSSPRSSSSGGSFGGSSGGGGGRSSGGGGGRGGRG